MTSLKRDHYNRLTWSDDITKAMSFEFKDEVDYWTNRISHAQHSYPVEAILTFGVENTQ